MLDQSISGSGERTEKDVHLMKRRMAHKLIQEGILVLIHLYQHTFSTLLGPCCRFTPSCSSYALLSVQRFGIIDGARLTCKRFVRCHPFHPGGYDPVPEMIKKIKEEM
jgi:putative membrane protein insertion efficiency factor